MLADSGDETDLLLFDNDRRGLLKLLMLPFNPVSYARVIRRVRAFRPDVVHVHNQHFAGSFSIFRALHHCRVPFVTTLHNYRLLCPSAILFNHNELFTDSVDQRFPWTAVKKGVYRDSKLLTFWLALSTHLHRVSGTLQLCNRYLVLTPFARQLFINSSIRLPASQIEVKPNFTERKTGVPVRPGNEFLFVGRLTEDKGVRILLEAFRDSPWQLKIVGTGALKADVMAAATECSNIRYLGQLNSEEVSNLMLESTALVFPSRWYEGMPMTILESFAAGCPVIASNIGAMKSMIQHEHNGLHFRAGSVSNLRDRLAEWTGLSVTRKELFRQNALQTYLENYTPDRNLNQLHSIYTTIIRDQTTRPAVLSRL